MSNPVQVENLHYAYPPIQGQLESKWALSGVSFSVNSGEFLSVMGPSAAGKSTLAQALLGIVPQSTGGRIHGRVLVDGIDVRTNPISLNAQHVGLVFQDPETQFFNMDVEAEVAYGLESMGLSSSEIVSRVSWALERVGMEGFRPRSPYSLSGGEKQRIAIAAILSMQPGVLVLDEPTTSLDPRGAEMVFETLDSLREKREMTIILISQDSEHVAAFSDRVIALESGKIVAEGAPEEIFAQASLLEKMGIRTPQIRQLAACLNRSLGSGYAFLHLEQAVRELAQDLERKGNP